MLYERVIAAIVPAVGIDRPEDVRDFFTEHMRKSAKARDVIRSRHVAGYATGVDRSVHSEEEDQAGIALERSAVF